MRRYSLALLDSPAAVVVVEVEAECREAVLPALFVLLNGLVKTKSMAVGRPESSPGAVGEEKMGVKWSILSADE